MFRSKWCSGGHFLVTLLVVGFFSTGALQASGGNRCSSALLRIDPRRWIEERIREDEALPSGRRQLIGAVRSVGFRAAALNREIVSRHHNRFTVEILQGPITNQAQSGRCWIFAGLNMVRSQLIEAGKVPVSFEFSQSYLFFFSMLWKANRFLEGVIRARQAPAGARNLRRAILSEEYPDDGGHADWFVQLVSEHGLVPKEMMPDTPNARDSALLRAELKEQLAKIANEMRREIQEHQRREDVGDDFLRTALEATRERGIRSVWRILTSHLGTPPREFEFEGAGRFTPTEFAERFVGFKARDYVTITRNQRRSTGKVFELAGSGLSLHRSVGPSSNQRFLNLSTDRFEELIRRQVSGRSPVIFTSAFPRSVDLSSGIMHPRIFLGDEIYPFHDDEIFGDLNPEEHLYYDVLDPAHDMVITGLEQPDSSSPVIKFKVENSHGDKQGVGGTFFMYREWFRTRVFEALVDSRILSPSERRLWDRGKATRIPTHEDYW